MCVCVYVYIYIYTCIFIHSEPDRHFSPLRPASRAGGASALRSDLAALRQLTRCAPLRPHVTAAAVSALLPPLAPASAAAALGAPATETAATAAARRDVVTRGVASTGVGDAALLLALLREVWAALPEALAPAVISPPAAAAAQTAGPLNTIYIYIYISIYISISLYTYTHTHIYIYIYIYVFIYMCIYLYMYVWVNPGGGSAPQLYGRLTRRLATPPVSQPTQRTGYRRGLELHSHKNGSCLFSFTGGNCGAGDSTGAHGLTQAKLAGRPKQPQPTHEIPLGEEIVP